MLIFSREANTPSAAEAAPTCGPECSETAQTDSVAPKLDAVLDDRFALTWKQVGLIVPFVLLFVVASHARLSGWQTWKHIANGEWILQHQTLPTSDPFLPMADGLPFKNATWVADVAVATIARQGLHWVPAISACLLVGLWACFAWGVYSNTKNAVAMLFSMTVFALAGTRLLGQLGPDTFGAVCVVALLWMRRKQRRHRNPTNLQFVWQAVGFASLFAVWANLNNAWKFGVLLLGCEFAADVVLARRRGSSWIDLWFHPRIRRSLVLFQISAMATFLNPRGAGIWHEVINAAAFSSSERALRLNTFAGLSVFLAIVAFFYSMRNCRTLLLVGVLFLFVGGTLVAWDESCALWFVPIMLILASEQFSAVTSPRRTIVRHPVPQSGSLQFAGSLVALLIVWMGFALSPASDPLLAAEPRTKQQLVAGGTPTEIVELLAEERSGLVWMPWYWADWMIFEQSQSERLQSNDLTMSFFADSRPGQLPPSIHRDYMKISRGEEWRRLADVYGIRTLVIDKNVQRKFVADYYGDGRDWTTKFENETVLVLVRQGV